MEGNLGEILVTAAIAAVPALLVAVFSWFKARAAQTPAKWDDNIVKAIEDIAKNVSGK